MTHHSENGNTLSIAGLINGTPAPLANVSLCLRAMTRAMERPTHLPGMVCFYGPSGWGKSTAACYCSNKKDTYYVQCQEGWTRKAFLLAILRNMGIPPEKTLYEMSEQICRQLADSARPLIIDEMDYVVKKGYVELIRDIYEGSDAAILLIGEENLSVKLQKWERFHGRVLDWVPAQPVDYQDCLHLVGMYCRDIVIGDDLLKKIHQVCKGSARRVCINIELARKQAQAIGLSEIGLKDLGDMQLFTGKPTPRRV